MVEYRSEALTKFDPSAEAGCLLDVRRAELSSRIVALIRRYAPNATRALDVGAQDGHIALRMARETGIHFEGIEPFQSQPVEQHDQIRIVKARAEDIPYADETFDLVTFLSVYEHIAPESRRRCLAEMHRVLKPAGVLIGQVPNMYYPIESHSHLPFQSYLPSKVGAKYYQRFAKVPWKYLGVNWYRVGPRQLKKDASSAGFNHLLMYRSSYSINVVPTRLRRWYPLMQAFPPNFDFVFRKSAGRPTAS